MSNFKKRKLNCASNDKKSESKCDEVESNRSIELKSSSMPKKGYLSNCDIFLYPASLSNTRKTLFENQITLNGGNLIKHLTCVRNYKEPYVLIDDNLIDRTRIDTMIKKVQDAAQSLR